MNREQFVKSIPETWMCRASAEKLYARGDLIARESIGASVTVRKDRNLTLTGIIVAAELHRAKIAGRNVKIVFRVTLKCGVAGVTEQVFLSSLPRK